MKAVLRLTLTYFDFVPLQRWVNAVGGVSLIVALVVGLAADSRQEARPAIGFTIMGITLIMLTPVFSSAVGMRIGSTRAMLHLRPHGRVKMLLAATLLITLQAAMVTLPYLVGEWAMPARAARVGAPAVFQIAWTVLALGWICIFALSRSMYTLGFMGLLPVLVMGIGKSLAVWIPDPVSLMALAAAAWALFCRWYLRTGQVTRPVLMSSMSMDSNGHSPIHWLLTVLGISDSLPSRQRATFIYLFGGPPSFFAVTGVWIALIFTAAHFIGATFNPRASFHGGVLHMLPFMAFFPAALALNIVRRGRLLWLRGGEDRTRLFHAAELLGLRATMTTWAIAAAAVVTVVLIVNRLDPASVLLYVASQAAVAVCLFYGGLSLINAWAVRDVLLGVGLALATLVQFFMLGPYKGINVDVAIGVLVVAAVLGSVLRWYASRAWTRLDWRVAKLPSWAVRTN